MLIRIGFDIVIDCAQPTPFVLKVQVEEARQHHLHGNDFVSSIPAIPLYSSIDMFGNRVLRGCAGPGDLQLRMNTLIEDDGLPDIVHWDAPEIPVSALPTDVLHFLQSSRYCESDALSTFAWSTFGGITPGWGRVQAIVDYVHNHLTFNYANSSALRTAVGAKDDRSGVCRDFAHLAIALCRAINIPARYCNGYLGDIAVPFNPAPMDFNAWFEAYLGGRWYTFDARHNQPRVGRITISRGLDAADCAMIHTFGPHVLRKFVVVTHEVPDRMGIAV